MRKDHRHKWQLAHYEPQHYTYDTGGYTERGFPRLGSLAPATAVFVCECGKFKTVSNEIAPV